MYVLLPAYCTYIGWVPVYAEFMKISLAQPILGKDACSGADDSGVKKV